MISTKDNGRDIKTVFRDDRGKRSATVSPGRAPEADRGVELHARVQPRLFALLRRHVGRAEGAHDRAGARGDRRPRGVRRAGAALLRRRAVRASGHPHARRPREGTWAARHGSTNGTLIDDDWADWIRDLGVAYVGISIDGTEEIHDAFRRHPGAYQLSLAAIRRLRDRGVKVGLRVTMTRDNVRAIPAIFDLMRAERVPRICLYHLVYTGCAI